MISHDLECPRHDYCKICSYDVMGADFENSLHAFGQSEKSSRVQCIITILLDEVEQNIVICQWRADQ